MTEEVQDLMLAEDSVFQRPGRWAVFIQYTSSTATFRELWSLHVEEALCGGPPHGAAESSTERLHL